jgi:capsular polysaccharide biosynthesis protein
MRSIVNNQPSTDPGAEGNDSEAPDLRTTPANLRTTPAMVTVPHASTPSAGFEPIGRSALAHPVLVVLCTVVGLLAGAGAGYVHPVSYTADSSLIVGRTTGIAEDELAGLAVAIESLASNYARLMTTSKVISATESILHDPTLPGTVSASPIPESSIIDVQAVSSTKQGALNLANAGAVALVNAVDQLTNEGQAQLQPLLSNYKKTDSTYEKMTVEASVLQGQLNALLATIGTGASSATEQAREQALDVQIAGVQTQADIAKFQADTYQNEYTSALPPLTIQEAIVQKVGNATYSGSNFDAYMEAGGLAGTVGGLVIGLAGAAMLDVRRGRRSLTARAPDQPTR